MALALDPRDTKRAVVASGAGHLITVDLETGKAVSKASPPSLTPSFNSLTYALCLGFTPLTV